MVKICGTRSAEAAKAAIEAGADLIGIIQVPGRSRTVPDDVASQISQTVKSTPRPDVQQSQLSQQISKTTSSEWFDHSSNVLRHPSRALLVGVFMNQSLSYILAQQQKLDLDVVQLHGSEPVEWASLIPVPVIHKFAPGGTGIARRAYHTLPLLDSGSGGTGQLLEVGGVAKALDGDEGLRIILAGGLNPDNVLDVVKKLGSSASKVVGLDVSSGVETDGAQDVNKIRAFVKAAKSVRS